MWPEEEDCDTCPQTVLFVKLFSKQERRMVYLEVLNEKIENWKPIRKK